MPTSTTIPENFRSPQYSVGGRYLEAAAALGGCMPVLIPGIVAEAGFDVQQLVDSIDGLLLTGGRANIEPHHFEGDPFPEDEVRDPQRDAVALPLVRACVAEGVPVFGICRGIQEINVALGGSLHYRLHLVPGKMDHRMRREGDTEHRMGPRHPVELDPEGLFAHLTGESEITVNSLHGQGIDRLGNGLLVEALAPDGVVEGIRHESARALTIGVQYHAEWRYNEHPLSSVLFTEFGKAAEARAARRRTQVAVP